MSDNTLWEKIFSGNKRVHIDDFIASWESHLVPLPSSIPPGFTVRELLLATRIHNKDDEVTEESFENFELIFGPLE